MATEITDANFDELVNKSDKPVVIDFWAEWCGPCRLIEPHIEALAKQYEGQALIAKVNVDENPQVTAQFGVRNIPTVLFIKNGEPADKQVGVAGKDVLEQKLVALF